MLLFIRCWFQVDRLAMESEQYFASAGGVGGSHRRKSFLDTMDACKQMLAGNLSRPGWCVPACPRACGQAKWLGRRRQLFAAWMVQPLAWFLHCRRSCREDDAGGAGHTGAVVLDNGE